MYLPSERQIQKFFGLAITVLIFSVLFWANSVAIADPDLWGHVRYGLDILHGKSVSLADPYSFTTAGNKWINHEWLSEVSFAYAYEKLGNVGLALVKIVVDLLITAVIYLHLRSLNYSAFNAGCFTLLVTILLGPGISTVRPQLFTYACLLALFVVLELHHRRHQFYLLSVPLIFLIWINSHGGVLAGLTIFLSFTVGGILFDKSNLRAEGLKILAITWTATVLCLLVNPYGFNLMKFLLETATTARPEIGEWNPVSITTVSGALYLFTVVLSLVTWIMSALPKIPSKFLVWSLLTLGPLISVRHLPLFAIALPFTAGEHIAYVWQKYSAKTWNVFSNTAGAFKLLVAALSMIGSVYFIAHGFCQVGQIRVPAGYPVGAVTVLKNSGVRGNLANDFDWGEYITWHLSPLIKVSIDGRRETVYPKIVYLQNIALLQGLGDWDAILRIYPVDMLLTSREFPLYNLMKLKSDWSLLYEDHNASLFAKNNSQPKLVIESYLKRKPVIPKTQEFFP